MSTPDRIIGILEPEDEDDRRADRLARLREYADVLLDGGSDVERVARAAEAILDARKAGA